MKRREFFRTSFGAGIAAGAALSLGGYDRLWAAAPGTAKYDMVAIMGGNPDAMFDLAIQELGGMETFVKKGQHDLTGDIAFIHHAHIHADVPPGDRGHCIE